MTEKSIQTAANVAKVGLFILWLVFMCTMMSCSSCDVASKSKTQKYYDKMVQHKQFAVVNN